MHSKKIEAFRSLCELIHFPTRKRLEAGLVEDWSQYPRVHAAVSDEALTPELAGSRIGALLEEALSALEDSYPPNGHRVSPLDVVRLHLIDGHSWDAIVAECSETGRSTSERTLRSRQRDGLAAVLEWAFEEAAADPVPDDVEAVPDAPHPTRPGASWAGAAVLIVVAIALGFWIGQGNQGPGHADRPQIGRHIPMPGTTVELPPPYPRWSLPNSGADYSRATVVEPAPDKYLVVAATTPTGPDGGSLVVFDPVAGRVVWTDRFRPTREMLHLADDADLAVQIESFRPEHLIYGDEVTNLGDRVIAVYVHRFSHCFVIEYDLLTGEHTGMYHHPGRLETHMLVDLDGDGRPTLLLGGQDDVLARPVLVALEPGHLHGNASTLSADRKEDACARVILPAVPQLQGEWGTPRLQVIDQVSHRWNPGLGMLSFSVGAHEGLPAYRVFLDASLGPAPGTAMSVGDGPALSWRGAGLDPTDLAPYVAQIGLIGRQECLPERVAP